MRDHPVVGSILVLLLSLQGWEPDAEGGACYRLSSFVTIVTFERYHIDNYLVIHST